MPPPLPQIITAAQPLTQPALLCLDIVQPPLHLELDLSTLLDDGGGSFALLAEICEGSIQNSEVMLIAKLIPDETESSSTEANERRRNHDDSHLLGERTPSPVLPILHHIAAS